MSFAILSISVAVCTFYLLREAWQTYKNDA